MRTLIRFWRIELTWYNYSRFKKWDNTATRGFDAGPFQFIFHKRYYR